MDLTTLRIFLEVSRRGSFAAVAQARAVAPSSISRAVASLEMELGVKLFQRTTRRLAPTEAGALLRGRLEGLVDELEGVRLLMREARDEVQGELRVLAPVSFALQNVVPLLPALAQRHPQLRFDLRLSDALLDLVGERIDVAIRLGPLQDSRLVSRRLAPMHSVIAASPAYLERFGRPEEPEDLAQHECLQLDMPGFSPRWRLRDAAGRVREVSVSGRLRTSNAVALKDCALAGMGVVLQARWILGRELRSGQLVDLFPGYDVTAATFDNAAYLLYPSRAYLPRKAQVFMDFMVDHFATHPPWDRPLVP
ncbi:MAG: LysR family transcriptional regulator [Acidobacteriota bacterium]